MFFKITHTVLQVCNINDEIRFEAKLKAEATHRTLARSTCGGLR